MSEQPELELDGEGTDFADEMRERYEPGEEPIESEEELEAAIESDEERIEDFMNQRPTHWDYGLKYDNKSQKWNASPSQKEAFRQALRVWNQSLPELPWNRVEDRRRQLRALKNEPNRPGSGDSPPETPGALLQKAVLNYGMPNRMPKEHPMTTAKMKAAAAKLKPILDKRQAFYDTPEGNIFLRDVVAPTLPKGGKKK